MEVIIMGSLTIEDRILLLREEHELSQEEFGEKIGVTKSTISLIERKLRNPSERVIRDICREFNVNEPWLRDGAEPKDVAVPAEDEYFKAVTQISKSNDKLAMQAIIEYWKLDNVSKESIKNYIYKIAEKSRE